MKVLLDACTPRPLRQFRPEHSVSTAQEMGWGQLKADRGFDAFISTDQNLQYQQRVFGRKVAILVLPTNDWGMIRSKSTEIAAAVAKLKPGDFVQLAWR